MLEKNTIEAVPLYDTMRQWQRDADLAGLRDEKDIAKLPADERAALTKFWAEVDRLAKQARASNTWPSTRASSTPRNANNAIPSK